MKTVTIDIELSIYICLCWERIALVVVIAPISGFSVLMPTDIISMYYTFFNINTTFFLSFPLTLLFFPVSDNGLLVAQLLYSRNYVRYYFIIIFCRECSEIQTIRLKTMVNIVTGIF